MKKLMRKRNEEQNFYFMILTIGVSLAVCFLSGKALALDPQKTITQYALDVWQTKDGLPQNSVQTIIQTRHGYLWVGTQEGFARFDGVKFTVFNRSNTEIIKNNYVSIIIEDKEGALWIGTLGGLIRLHEGKFKTYKTNEGLSVNNVRTIYEDKQGTLWVGTDLGLNKFNNDSFTVFTTQEGLSNNNVKSIYEDQEGNLWIGTDNGLNKLKNGKFTVYSVQDGLSHNNVRALCVDREGTLWVGTFGGGVNRFKNGKFTIYTTNEGLSNNNVRAILEDSSGNIWIGTAGGGLNLYKDGTITTYTTKEGLSDDFIMSIYEDNEGTLWIGTLSGGLNRLKDGKFTSYTTKNGLFDDVVFCILEDQKGNLWMSCNKGIFRVSKKELEDFSRGIVKSISCVSYGMADGMKSSECNGGNWPSGWKTRDRKLWFPTLIGVAVIDPENIKINKKPPPLLIEQVIIDDEPIDLRSKIRLPPGKKRFEFYYTGLSFLGQERVWFRYKLEGFDKNWIEAGPRRVAYYTNIPPGDYRFWVKGCNNDGIWNEAGASFEFFLRPHFYQTYFFYGLCALSLVGLGAGLYWLRVRGLKAREQELVLLVDERTKELQQYAMDLERSNQDLQQFAYVASHDLQEPLRMMASYTQLLARRYKGRLDSDADDFINYTVDSAARMQSLIDDLLAYARVQTHGKPFELTDVEEVLSQALGNLQLTIKEREAVVTHEPLPGVWADRGQLVQLFQNLLSNAIKFCRERRPEIHVGSEQRDEEWLFWVRDNGIGINPKYWDKIFLIFQRLHGKGEYPGTGIGLAICKRIVERHGGRIWVKSQPGIGSIFYFTLKTKEAREERKRRI